MDCEPQPEDQLTPSDLWQEHVGHERRVTGPTPPVPSEPPWFVAHAFSILILLAGLSVWVGRHFL